ncbi:glutaminyl-peptide cyclotransferase [Flavihumibacter petaseus]|uniref:Putative glutaminyl cyclase n=1 Tax=Flavihumibacter petaseus NBRC 106054 TaxID=1220578 RepID=A0A0E9MUZ3_9BACT|nr:glutaminyl-peptide cyclotransferase [Flavihumibacter petaseus]GAO41379.1 putative glutaminyl cyclase [Flavihumibacter petaseus NBRC 106054]
MKKKLRHFLLPFLITLGIACHSGDSKPITAPETTPAATSPFLPFTVIGVLPHDTSLFTEGLFYANGKLFESTGSPDGLSQTESVIGYHDSATGRFQVKVQLDKQVYFGEGIAQLKDKIYQLTYRNRKAFVYDTKTFKKTGEFAYTNTEGWGLTTDSTHLIMSDGTDKLTFLDPKSPDKPVRILSVTDAGVPRDSLNELEYIHHFIYANVWMHNTILKIDPQTGQIVGKLDLSSITKEIQYRQPGADVLNGIAYDPTRDRLLITGKLWPSIYVLKIQK